MSTSNAKKQRKLSWSTLLSVLLAVVPILLDAMQDSDQIVSLHMRNHIDEGKFKITMSDEISGKTRVLKNVSYK